MSVNVFSVPKPWKGEIDLIQRNALKSWKRLNCKVTLLGDDKGTKEISNEINVSHVPDIAKNKSNTPLFNSIIDTMNKQADDIILYTNADIILCGNIKKIANLCKNKFPEFLAVGRRINVEVKREVNFSDKCLKNLKSKGKLQHKRSRDYFLFPKNMFQKVPEFAIGRGRWDSWMVGEALLKNIPVIDLSGVVDCFHQNHDFNHIPNSKIKRGSWGNKGPECFTNKSLVSASHPCNKTLYTTHEMVFESKELKLREFVDRD